jgi:glycosyltransferase involved in cell wall biosynthesis
MKIAYVTMHFPVPSEAFAAVEIRALQRQGAEVTVLAYRGAPADAGQLLAERGLADLPVDYGGIAATLQGLLAMLARPGESLWLLGKVLRGCWRNPGHLLKALSLMPRSFAMLQKLEALRPEVVHLFWGHYPSLLGLLVRRSLPGVVISQFLGAYDLERRFPLSAALAQQADVVITHARANLPALAMLGLPEDRVDVAYRGIEIPPDLLKPGKTRGLMVVAERLVPQKRTADALRLFAEIARRRPEAQLMIFGGGPEAGRLQTLAAQLGIAERTVFAGHVPQPEVLRALEAAEVALTLSQSPSERLPNVLKEAMLRRCLCLSTRSPGIGELVEDGETGLLVEAGNSAAAAQRLMAVLADPQAVERIGQAAQDRVRAGFDVDRLMADRLARWSALVRRQEAGAAA